MDRETRTLREEIETVIRLHRHGLYHTQAYQDRKRRVLDYVRENEIRVEDLDPVTLILYRRYFE